MKDPEAARERIRKTWEANSIAEKARLAIMRHMPPAAPGRGKRQRDDLPFLEAVAAFLDRDGGELAPAMLAAIETGDTEIFKTIIEAKAYVDAIPHSGFSRRVMEVLRCKIDLRTELGRNPTKQEVRAAVSFTEDVPQRWTEIFKAAGLAWLPIGKPSRKRKKHGDRYRLKP